MRMRSLSILMGVAVLAACGNSPERQASQGQNQQITIPTPPAQGTSRAGQTIQMKLTSASGFDIAFTVFEPTTMTGGQTYELILEGHGFGGSRQQSENGFIKTLRDDNYYVISIDQRGFGESGGTVRVMDPDFEGRDLIQILDWAEANLELRYDNGNAVVGSYGGSYGGGYQLLLNAVDPKKRLDALVPDITWNDLRYSLYPQGQQGLSNGSLKQVWVSTLFGAGTAGSGGNMDPYLNTTMGQALTTNSIPQEALDLFYEHSPAYWCDGNTSTPPPGNTPGGVNPANILFMQGAVDSLFNVTEAYRNYQCYNGLGKDVRIWVHNGGHVVPPVPQDGHESNTNCGTLEKNAATLAWFDAHLRGNTSALDNIPEICIATDGNNAFSLGSLPHDGTGTFPHGDDFAPSATLESLCPSSTFTTPGPLGDGGCVVPTTATGATPLQFVLHTASNPEKLAGVPTAEITISSGASAGNPPGVYPIIYVGLINTGRNLGPGNWVATDHQLHPLRGFGTHTVELGGIAEDLGAGDTVSLVVYFAEQQEYGAVTGTTATIAIKGTVNVPIVP